MTKELLTVKSKPRGPINYWPYQDVDDVARRAVEKFQVTPFGQIHNCCAHIPYNSGKKDFYEKTGRESFEGGFIIDVECRVRRLMSRVASLQVRVQGAWR